MSICKESLFIRPPACEKSKYLSVKDKPPTLSSRRPFINPAVDRSAAPVRVRTISGIKYYRCGRYGNGYIPRLKFQQRSTCNHYGRCFPVAAAFDIDKIHTLAQASRVKGDNAVFCCARFIN